MFRGQPPTLRAERLAPFPTGCTAQRTSVTAKLFRVAVRLTQGYLLPVCGRCGLRYLSLSSSCGCSHADRALRLAMSVAGNACVDAVYFHEPLKPTPSSSGKAGSDLEIAWTERAKQAPDNEGAGPLVGSLVFVFDPAPLETRTTSHVWWKTNAQLLRLALRPGSTS